MSAEQLYQQYGPLTLPTATDLSGKVGCAAVFSSGNWAMPGGQGVVHQGIVVDTEVASAKAISVETRIGVVVPVKVGSGGVTQGAEITPEGTSGEFEDAGSSDWVRAIALKAGSDGEIVPALTVGHYIKA